MFLIGHLFMEFDIAFFAGIEIRRTVSARVEVLKEKYTITPWEYHV